MQEDQRQHQHLAWHETLELHELVAFQANGLMGFKKNAILAIQMQSQSSR